MIRGYSDHAANERTFLAWVRTGVAVVAFGFVIEKFNLFLTTVAGAVEDTTHRARLERLFGPLGHFEGLAFMVVGLVLVVLAAIRFVRAARLLDDQEMHPASDVHTELLLSGALVLLIASYGVYLTVH
jgi:putative membrane protein